MPLEWGFAWLMIFLRGMGVILLIPTLAGQSLPVMVRLALSACLATLFAGLVPAGGIPASLWGMISAAAGEVILGLVFGFVGRLVFATVELGARLIANEIGLVAAPGFDVPQPSQEPLAALLSMFAGLLFFLLGAHLGVLSAFARSFDFSPAGVPGFGAGSVEVLVQATARVIEVGFRIAAPFIGLNFLTNLAFSVLGRAVPKMNVFILSYSFRLLAGFALLAGSGGLIARYLSVEFDLMPFRLLELLPPGI
jgi:flagellar biosynthesis protein FliR